MSDSLDQRPKDQPEDERAEAKPPEQPLPARLVHQPQEIAPDSPESRCTFQAGPDRQLMMTPAALSQFDVETILACFYRLQYLARLHDGLDYLQVFVDPESGVELWFIEDAPGVITALLPDDR